MSAGGNFDAGERDLRERRGNSLGREREAISQLTKARRARAEVATHTITFSHQNERHVRKGLDSLELGGRSATL